MLTAKTRLLSTSDYLKTNESVRSVVRRTEMRRTIRHLLVERNSDVDYRVAEEIDEGRLSGYEIYPIEARHAVHNHRRETVIVDGHAVLQRCVDVEADRRVGIDGQLAGRHKRACIGWRLDDHLVQGCVDVE